MRRRTFLGGSLAGAALWGCKPWTHPSTKVETANAHERATLAAMAEAFLPGGDGTPGATDVHALSVILEPAYGVNPYISEVVSDLDEWCLVRHHHVFVELPPETRELALEERMGLHGKLIASWYLPVYEGILALAKLALFGALVNPLGTSWLAFPGESRGYAPASAGGAWAATDTPKQLLPGNASTIVVDGTGTVAAVHASVLATSDDAARASLRIVAPDGRHHDLAVRADDGTAMVADAELPLAGGPAAGAWRLEVGRAAGEGVLALWSLRIATDLDEATWRK